MATRYVGRRAFVVAGLLLGTLGSAAVAAPHAAAIAARSSGTTHVIVDVNSDFQ